MIIEKKKSKVKKPKISLYVRQKKKVDPRSFTIITLYKKIMKIQKTPLGNSCVFFPST